MSPNFELASVLTRVAPNNSEILHAQELFRTHIKTFDAQQNFYAYCYKWKLAPWVKLQLETFHLWEAFYPAVQEQFTEQYESVLAQNNARNEAATIFLKRFAEENIPVVVLKGNCLAHTVYGSVGYKRMNDFDMLIRKGDWDRIQSIYLELGYIPLGFGWSGEKEKPAKFSHVGMSFISPDYTCITGSQWGLKSPTTVYKDQILGGWSTTQPFDFNGVQISQLSPEYNLLHLILHLGIYKCGIRDCMDLSNLLRSHTIDPEKMAKLLIQSNAVEKAVFALEITQLSAPGCAEQILAALKPKHSNFLMKRLRKRMQLHQLTGDYQEAYNDYFQDIEKEVIYFNLFHKFHVKSYFYWRILKLIYFPKKEIVQKLNDLPAGTSNGRLWRGRMSATKNIFALIAQEIGWKFTLLIFVKLGLDTLISLKNYLLPKKSYFDYLKSRNIDPKTIEKVVKNIQ